MRPGVFVVASLAVGAVIGPALITALVWVAAVWCAVAGAI